jgi:RNA polymerase sigma factor (sigma-70 family)
MDRPNVVDPDQVSRSSSTREPFGPEPSPSLVMSSDRVRAAQAGDLLALGDLLDALLPWVGQLCGSIALDSGPDATQETMIQVMRDLKGLRDPKALRGWVRRIATREAIRHAQRSRREPGLDPLDESIANRGANAAPDPMLARDVARVLADLSPDQRAILVLRDLEGLSEAEAARHLDIAQGTIKSRLHRAREAFRSRWSA